MEFEDKYANRLLSDIADIKASQETELHAKTSSYGLEIAFNSVKSMCMDEVLKIKENNDVLAKYVENFSNKILKLLSGLEENERMDVLKIQSKLDLLNEMVETAKKKKKEPSTKSVTKRERKIRSVGERPERLKDIRNNSTPELEQAKGIINS